MLEAHREGKALILATRPYAKERRRRSVAEALLTLALIVAALVAELAGATPDWARVALAPLTGLLLVRGFVVYHDHQHGAILRGSAVAEWIAKIYGLFLLTPSRVWRDTHNYHHAHNAKMVGSHIGSFPTLSVGIWEKLSRKERILYALARHPLTVLSAYLTIFLGGMCIKPALRNPRRYALESALALGLHLAIVMAIVALTDPLTLALGFLLPMNLAFIFGAYLFYAQHNFEGIHLAARQEWEASRAALRSSSHLELGPVMRWLTANIGYHHVHHLNARIPFYRLPEAMAEIPELSDPPVTTLHPRDVAACFRLKLWDEAAGRMRGFPSR